MSSSVHFSTFDVSKQTFFRTPTTAGVVNLMPIVPGHVLVIPRRVVARVSDLTSEEAASLFTSVQAVGRMIEKAYNADGLTIACQDGIAAGQSVPHVHFHILPRKLRGDHFKNNDDVYPELETHGQTLQKILKSREAEVLPSGSQLAGETLKMDVRNMKPRSMAEMEQEANWLRSFTGGTSDVKGRL